MNALINSATVLQGYWPVLMGGATFLVVCGYLYSQFLGQITALKARIASLEAKDALLNQLSTTVATIDAKLTVLLPDYNGK